MAGEIQLNGTTALTESGGAVTLNNVDSATNRTNLGLGTAATSASTDFVGTSRTITAGTGLSGGGDLSANRTINVSFSANESNVKTALNASGSANVYACRAWVNFNGEAASIGSGRANGGVSSVGDNASGDYTINLSPSMSDENYSVVASSSTNSSYGVQHAVINNSVSLNANVTPTASACRVSVRESAGTGRDGLYVCVAIFR